MEKYKTKREQPCRTCGRIIRVNEMLYQTLMAKDKFSFYLVHDCEQCGLKRMEAKQ